MGLDLSPTETVYRFEDFRLDRRRGLSRRRGNGAWEPVALGSRAVDVLGALVGWSGELVTKQALMDTAWPGVVVEDGNLTMQISTLRRTLDEGRAGGSCIRTVIGRGYRFLPGVTVEMPSPEPGAGGGKAAESPALPLRALEAAPVAEAPAAVPYRRPRHLGPALIAALVAICLGLGTAALWRARDGGRPVLLPAPRLSVVVLPFQNLSGDPSQDYLADAITDDLSTDLSHIPQAFVIANASARAVNARNIDLRQIGRELGVRYVIEGSTQRIGSSLRVNAQLASTETGAQLWADRYEQDIADLASGEEKMLARMRGALGLGLVDIEAERSRRERPSNPDAFDLILRARWWSNQPPSPRRTRAAQELYQQALRLDPGSVFAMTGLANALSDQDMNWAGQWLSGDTRRLAEKLVADALALAPLSEAALVAQARLLHGQARFGELLTPSQHLVELYPNNPEGYHHLARVRQFEGRFDDAVAMFEKAIRLDPLEPRIFQRYGFPGFSLMLAGRYDDSAAWFARSLAANPDAPPPLLSRRWLNMSASLALAGRLEEAHHALGESQRLWPFETVRGHYPLDLNSPALVARERVWQQGLALAGLRDHAEENADFGVPPDTALHTDLAGYTPTRVPGVTTIRTGDLARMLEGEPRPIMLDAIMNFWGRSLPGAVGLTNAGLGGGLDDQAQERLRRVVAGLTCGDISTPIVTIGWNSERFDGYNLALRLVALGYTNLHWYRGGREAWEVAGLPETELVPREW